MWAWWSGSSGRTPAIPQKERKKEIAMWLEPVEERGGNTG
jgi:hypothetical protein